MVTRKSYKVACILHSGEVSSGMGRKLQMVIHIYAMEFTCGEEQLI